MYTDGSWTDDRGAIDKLSTLLDYILERCPDAVLIVAQIVGTPLATVQKRYDAFNAKIPGVVKRLVDAGKKVIAQDMTNVKGALINQEGKIDP